MAPADSHSGCRLTEFARWNRIMLEHEREHLSKAMTAGAFMQDWERELIVHDITDIDFLLQQIPVRVEAPK